MSDENPYREELPDGSRIERPYRKEGGKRVPRGNWQWVVYDPDRRPARKRVNLRTKDKGAAMKTALDHARARSLGTFDPWTSAAAGASSPALADAVREYLAERRHTSAPKTVESDASYLGALERQLPGGSALRHVEVAHVAAVVNARKKPPKDKDGRRRGPGPEASPETKKRRRATLQRFFAWAVARGYARTNPADDVALPKMNGARRDGLTEKEATALLRAVRASELLSGGGTWLSDWVVFGLGTGLRPGEQQKLRWSAVRLSERAVEVGRGHRVKTAGSRRRVPVAGEALAVLQRLHDRRTTEADGPVFMGASGDPVNVGYVTKRLKALATRAKVDKDLSAYSLRHAYGSRMAAAGVPLLDLARLMGTGLRMIEKHYGHYDPSRGASHVERVFGKGTAVDESMQ